MIKHTISIVAILFVFSFISQAADQPSIISIKSGNFSNPQNWQPQRLPKANDHILIQRDTTITFDLQNSPVYHTIHVAGHLNFAQNKNTTLNVGLLKIQPANNQTHTVEDVHKHDHHPTPISASLNVGTPNNPIPAKHTARIRLHFLKGMNPENEPAIIARPGGSMNFHGSPLTHTWTKLNANANPGDTTVTASNSLQGWNPGDQIIITASKRAQGSGTFRPGTDFSKTPQTEQRTIKSITNNTITFDQPLKFEHFGTGEFRSEVANLSRNVIVESANPKGVRGHTMFHYASAGAISYARFAHLGKENILGRYPIHFHLVEDSMRGSSVIGAAIVDSHNRWVTVHGTQYIIVKDCIGYQSVGHGFFLEDATEVYNLFDRNLAVQAYIGKRMKNQALPFDPNDGAGFWWSNGLNTFTRNVSCENDEYGYRYDMQHSRYLSSTMPIRQPDGTYKKVDVRTLPIWRFDHNEAHAEGFYGMVVAANGGKQPDSPITTEKQLEYFRKLDWTAPDTKHPHTITNLTIWGAHYAFRPHSPAMRMENIRLHNAAYGVYRPAFENHEYKNLHISKMGAEPFNRGMDDASAQTGSITVDGLTFTDTNYGGKDNPLIHMSDNNLSGDAETHIRNLNVVRTERYKDRWPTFNIGGGARAKPITQKTVPYYIHNHFGENRHAKIVTTQSKDHLNDGNKYTSAYPLTGPDAHITEVKNITFPKLLNPVDDLPPATTITNMKRQKNLLTVHGISHDNGLITKVTVNNLPATLTQLSPGVTQWHITLRLDNTQHPFTITAKATDNANNTELTPHIINKH